MAKDAQKTDEQAVEQYFDSLRKIKATGAGTGEMSYYAPLEALLNTIGKNLSSAVLCVHNLENTGAGAPDFGLFTSKQLQSGKPRTGQKPERGVIEVKGTSDDAWLTVQSGQVSKYWAAYRLVLVTNYRDFLLLGEDESGKSAKLESFRLAGSEDEFWSKTQNPRKYAKEAGKSLAEYLRRALTQNVSLREPGDVAWFLASYAHDALGRVEKHGDIPALGTLRSALEDSLGIKFEGEDGDHFFQSSLVQTLFYGMFSAWVLWARQTPAPGELFDWRTAAWNLRVPMLRALFQQVSDPARLKELDLIEVLDWAGSALNRIDRPGFFARFKDAEAVQYFYEPFLKAFDQKLRKKLGVWYTPPEVVAYMVARVDKALKEDLGIDDGLAADNVYVLDPCAGTGAYLAEVLRRIAANLDAKGLGGLKGPKVKEAAMTRVFGFEIMPAPFMVAHLQIGLVLRELNAELAENGGERASVYLTNALTGWEPTDKEKQIMAFPEMTEERERANDLKREKPILVILGNPPYDGFPGMAIDEEKELSNAYSTVRKVRPPEGQGRNDLYVRFFRMAERRITEKTGKGIVCFISNYSWLDGLSHPGMREHYLDVFDAIRIDNLNGDKFATGKKAPDGSPDPSIFSTRHNPEGIEPGTAIATLIRKKASKPAKHVELRNLWGTNKHQQLLDSCNAAPKKLYKKCKPILELGLPFLDAVAAKEYFTWPSLTELLAVSFPGVKTSRDEFLVDIDEDNLHARIEEYFDASIPDDVIAAKYPAVMKTQARFDGPGVRKTLMKRGADQGGRFVRYAYRPFDIRWLYWEPETKLLDERRADYLPHVFDGNMWIEARERQSKTSFDRGTIVSSLADNFGSGLSNFFPAYLLPDDHSNGDKAGPNRANLTESVKKHLTGQKLNVEHLFLHIAAVLHSPQYRAENNDALRLDWPRIPFPDKAACLRDSAGLGGELAALLDPEKPAPKITKKLKSLGVPSKSGGGDFTGADFTLNAKWGNKNGGSIVMPGVGTTTERDYSPKELKEFEAGASAFGVKTPGIKKILGEKTLDVYLNKDAFWANVPVRVWEYKLGGYQVIKKWLSYREESILGRPLKIEEVQHVTDMVRRIAAVLLLGPALDANYKKAKAAHCWEKGN